VRDVTVIAGSGVTGLSRAPHPLSDNSASPRFSLLGPVEVRKDDRDYAPTAPKTLQLLALLLMRSGHLVHTDSIIHEVWSEEPPRSVRTGVQTLVYQLRRCMQDAGLGASGRRVLATRGPGYVLRVEPGHIDVVVFRQLVAQGQEAFHAGQYEEAARLLRSGLDLWSDTPLANVPCGPVLSSYVVELQEQLRAARFLRIQAEIEAGRAQDLIAELRALVSSDPLDEGSHAQLMQVLGSAGRRSEALALYRQLRERLIEELGLEPCEQVQQLHYDLLRAGGLSLR
jgi:DNA-binding SARP family transcriptional activator